MNVLCRWCNRKENMTMKASNNGNLGKTATLLIYIYIYIYKHHNASMAGLTLHYTYITSLISVLTLHTIILKFILPQIKDTEW
jgi:hypothetical protein